MRLDRGLWGNLDWFLLALVLAICLLGLVNIYSTGFSLLHDKTSTLFVKQSQWLLMGLCGMVIAFFLGYRFIASWAYVIYALSVILLVIVLFYGHTTHGSQRWINIAGFSFQPSEMVKLTMILALARYFNDHPSPRSYTLKELLPPLAICVLPLVLILRQPDLGTALMLLILFVSFIPVVGIRWRDLVTVTAVTAVLVPMGWFFLKDYQKERILTFINPYRDPLGSGYHIIQSMIAVGSGGVLGKGFLKGTQTQLKFLPEQQTDFIFSVFAEEWGFLGGVILLAMFTLLVVWGLRIALHSRDYLGTLVAYGITALIFWGAFINMGMVLGLLPVVGVPLPFFSYGGSAMVMLMTAVGILLNISTRRFILQS